MNRFDFTCVATAHLSLVLSVGCGTQSDSEIPPELLDAIAQRQTSADYPPGPTGGNVGEVASDICFPAWSNPVAQAYDPEALRQRCLSDYWDPDASQHRLLFVVSSAIWCQSCQTEFGGSPTDPSLGAQLSARHDAGLRALGGLFENAQFKPATVDDGVRWAQAFDVDFPFGVDSEFVLGRFARADAQPMHMLIDTQTMEIVYKATGGSIELLWERVDNLLNQDGTP